MSQELEQKFSEEILEGDWSMLKHHHKKDALFFIDKSIGLIEGAVAIATDDFHKVKSWKDLGLLKSLSAQECLVFQKTPHKKIANFLVIQPFVLARLI